jgi:hypothetical protein
VTPGYHVMLAEKYHADPCVVPSLNNTVAQILLDCSPRKAWFSHPRLNPAFKEINDDKFDLGKVAHSFFLEGDTSRVVVVEANDWRTNKAKEEREAARAAGKTALLARHHADVLAMVEAAQKFVAESEIAEYWHDAESELTAICNEGNVWLRSRLDRVTKNRRLIIDYKSTTDAAPEAFSRQIVRMGYHIQEAFYRRVVRNLGNTGPRFVFIAQSCEPPYECSLHGCHTTLQEIADAQVERAIQLWRECLAKKQWPSHGGRIHWTTPPTYMLQEHELRMAA